MNILTAISAHLVGAALAETQAAKVLDKPSSLLVSSYGSPKQARISWVNGDASLYTVAYDGRGKARGTLQMGLQMNNNDTVTIGGKVYTFQTTLTNADGNVLIGSDAEATIDNFVSAINLSGAGTPPVYGVSMTKSVHVSAVKSGTNKLVVTALLGGADGNAITTTEVGQGVWDAATLLSGSDAKTTVSPGVTFYKSGLTGSGTFFLTHYGNGFESDEVSKAYDMSPTGADQPGDEF